MGIIKSVSDNEDEILLGILTIHNNGKPFDVDCCYSKGSFYKSGAVPQPRVKLDLAPQIADVEQADCCALPIQDSAVGSIIFDPPFMFNPHGQALAKNRANLRFTMFKTWDSLVQTYQGAMREFYRILTPGGIVAFKCQDYTDAKTTMTHCFVFNWAQEQGFYVKDFFVRYRLSGPAYNPALRQKHARKFHSYWFVLEKPRRKPLDTAVA